MHTIDLLMAFSPLAQAVFEKNNKDSEKICKRPGNQSTEAQSRHYPEVFPSPEPWYLCVSKGRIQ